MAEIAPKPVKLPPFQAWLASNIPAVYDNTMSYYDELTSLIKWLETEVVPNVNSAIVLVNQLRNFVENYFDNLDVQEEINNKLDQMAEDGTLQEIIAEYIQANVAWTFDTVADMKLATNLVNGSYAKTLGFRSVDDGGGALYYITSSGTANEMDVIAIGALFANLVDDREYTAKQFGAYGDGTHDDTTYLQEAIDFVSSKKGKLTLTNGTYMVDAITSLFLKSNLEINFVNAKIKAITNNQTTYNVLSIINTENCVINDAVIEGDKDTHTGDTGEFGYGVNIRGASSNIIFNNLTVSNCWGDGIFIRRERFDSTDYYPDGIWFNGYTRISDCRRQGVSIISGENLYFDKLICRNISGVDPSAGVDVEPGTTADKIGNIYINYLETDGTLKGFTLRLRCQMTGDVIIGEINHHHQNTIPYGAEGRYEHAFRCMFEYFDADQAKYKVCVDRIYSDHNGIQLENLYNDVTPQVIVGDVIIDEYSFIYGASPAVAHRSLCNIRYTETTNLSNSLG